jgi:hypothetical protein
MMSLVLLLSVRVWIYDIFGALLTSKMMLRNMHQISDFGVLAFWRRQVIHE